MADYTPDTETVREQYTREQPAHISTVTEKGHEFDRWLAQERAEAGAQALDSMAEFFETSAALGTGDRDLIAAAAVRERAARLRGGDDRG